MVEKKKKYHYFRETETYNGKQYEGSGKTKADARRRLEEKLKAAKRGDVGVGVDMSVKNWANTWLETYNKPRVRKPGDPKMRGTMNAATYKSYEQLVNNYIVPELGTLRMREVMPTHLQKLLNEHKDMSFSQVSKLNITVKKMFSQAYTDRIISYDPSTGLKLPAAKKGRRRSLTDEEKLSFFQAAEKNKHGLLFRFLAATGVRPNELAAVLVGDVDLTQKLVHIRQAVETGSKEISTPKTASGIRYTVINESEDKSIVADLRKHTEGKGAESFLFTKKDGGMLTRQAFKTYWQSFYRTWDLVLGAEHDIHGHIYDPSDLKEDGTPIYPDQNDPSMPRNGHKLSPEICAYCLRHTFGTDMQRGNVPIEVTKYLMGHADISTTANIYVDTGKKDAIRAVGILHSEIPMENAMEKNFE